MRYILNKNDPNYEAHCKNVREIIRSNSFVAQSMIRLGAFGGFHEEGEDWKEEEDDEEEKKRKIEEEEREEYARNLKRSNDRLDYLVAYYLEITQANVTRVE